MSTASSGRRPLGEVSESYLNSPKREFHKGLGSKTAIKTDKKSSSAAKFSIEIDKDESLKKKGPEPSSRSSKSVTKPGSTVEVTFPVGSMGLDLEPLISSVSPERLIGCRIKDFYFGIDHSGIDERALRAVVAPGHIVASIDGEEVLFAQFMDILNKLRQLKLKERKICFKALSTEESKFAMLH